MPQTRALDQLWNHANFPGAHTERAAAGRSFVCALQAGAPHDELKGLAEDLVRVFQQVAQELPREADATPRLQVAYAISCVLSEALVASLSNPFSASLGFRIARLAYALEQFLAGDVEDLLEGFSATPTAA